MERYQYLGASEVACILGISPFGDAYKVYIGKTNPTSDNIPTGKMQLGLDSEDFVLTQFEKKFNTTVTNKQDRRTHWLETWAGCTLDGMADVEQYPAVVEAKTISTPLYNTPPEYYAVQVLWQQFVAGVDHGYLAVWSTKDAAFRSYPIHLADHYDKFIDALHKCKAFWFNHVVPKIPPVRERVERQSTELPEDLLYEYCLLQDQIKDLTERKDALKQEIVEAVGCPSELKAKSSNYQLDITETKSRRLDTKKLEADNPDLVVKYYGESVAQRVTVKRLANPVL